MIQIRGWVLTAEILDQFYLRVRELPMDTRENRVKLMNQMMHEFDIKALKDAEDVKKKIRSLKAKSVLIIKKGDSNG